MIRTWLLASSALLGASVLAQPPVKVGSVAGVVTTTQTGGTSAAAPGAALAEGARLVTTSSASATVQGPGGCSVRVPPGHALTVQGTSCDELRAGVVPVIPDVAARSPNAPPPRVVDRLIEVGASPTAIGVLQQLTDEPLSQR